MTYNGSAGTSSVITDTMPTAVGVLVPPRRPLSSTEGLAPMRDAESRFWARVERTPTCWLWRGAVSKAGYGSLSVGGRNVRVHRFAYELLVGPIPAGLTLDHLCRVRHCVNPSHLEPVTSGENTLRGYGPTAEHARQTHCINGHAFAPESAHRERDGIVRRCRICGRASWRASKARRTGKTPGPRTHCPNGHPYTAENTRSHFVAGRRACLICTRARWNRNYARRTGKALTNV